MSCQLLLLVFVASSSDSCDTPLLTPPLDHTYIMRSRTSRVVRCGHAKEAGLVEALLQSAHCIEIDVLMRDSLGFH